MAKNFRVLMAGEAAGSSPRIGDTQKSSSTMAGAREARLCS